ncbi:MAG: hypothetical protein OIF36_01760 [Alphaproteobacteria bacterium]|nr:hypothetical protein [Alphaproteobacteria bacterium]
MKDEKNFIKDTGDFFGALLGGAMPGIVASNLTTMNDIPVSARIAASLLIGASVSSGLVGSSLGSSLSLLISGKKDKISSELDNLAKSKDKRSIRVISEITNMVGVAFFGSTALYSCYKHPELLENEVSLAALGVGVGISSLMFTNILNNKRPLVNCTCKGIKLVSKLMKNKNNNLDLS